MNPNDLQNSPGRAQAQPANAAAPPANQSPATPKEPAEKPSPHPPAAPSKRRSWLRTALITTLGLGILAAALYFGIPFVQLSLNTVSTDDAYVNSHVTFVAARVAGQVVRVLVDDNYRVKKGDLLVQIDKQPYQVLVDIKKANLNAAKADLEVASAQVRAAAAQARSTRFKLEHAMEKVKDQVAQLGANVAALDSELARRERAKKDFERIEAIMKTPGAVSQQDYDLSFQNYQVAKAQVRQGLESINQIRAGLGLATISINPAEITKAPKSLAETPDNLDQDFSTVRQAAAEMLQTVAPLGVFPSSYELPPKKILAEFLKRDSEGKGDIDRIYAKIIQEAPSLKQAQTKVLQAERDLDQALLNLSYTDVFAEIDGVITRRNVNPGNNIQAGQSLMAIRSLTEIWIDANFKETQLADLRIGQRVRLDVDMYGSRQEFEGRITGFTMGTGQTLALLPPQNATGNFVKIVQRLPVRIELTNYVPDKNPLFVGLSVTPYVYFKEPPTGPNAGAYLQPYTKDASR